MDFQPNQFDNVKKAIGMIQDTSVQIQPQAAVSPALSLQQRSENYNTFDELMKQGVYLPGLLKRLDDLESKVKVLESQPAQEANEELFAMMEQAVCNDPEVELSRHKVDDIGSTILNEIYMNDQRYKSVREDYVATVKRVYLQTRDKHGATDRTACEKEQTSHRDGSAEICNDSERCVSDKEGVPSEQKTQ